MRTHAARFHVDPERLGAAYFSGGGPQLSWLLREQPAYVRCAAAFYAMLDLRHLVPSDADAASVEAARRFSATTYLQNAGPKLPLFVARAGLDSPMVNLGLDTFLVEAVATNAALDLMNHPRGVHAFECLTDEPRTHEIIRAFVAFLQTHLQAAAPGVLSAG